jgi:hypothetical protein
MGICEGTLDEKDRRERERRDREFAKVRDVLADAQQEIERLWLAGRLE